jgi:hypothetical protein
MLVTLSYASAVPNSLVTQWEFDRQTSSFELSFGAMALARSLPGLAGPPALKSLACTRSVGLAVAVCPRGAPRQDRLPALTLLASQR